ncbi:DUF5816 domain-containing protein [Halocatena salina]|uniref:DUF5816 domain-containing protein n=1 Tax=Halocatena salina TaxID=2934340 RepID=A0A8U0A417_9EURY|nr:DUF5816 domain-containing protein [Halocatena salina]UPM43198.1 DUF5816 domain-containing protein [Halocatena salina]
MEERTHPGGETLYVDFTQAERGSKAPFYVVYNTDQKRWGFFCSNCESFDTAVDSMGRIKCDNCSNLHKAEEWDAAHE